MSGIYGFPVLTGFPRFLHGAQDLKKKIGIPVADPKKHGSFVRENNTSGHHSNDSLGLGHRSHILISIDIKEIMNHVYGKRQLSNSS